MCVCSYFKINYLHVISVFLELFRVNGPTEKGGRANEPWPWDWYVPTAWAVPLPNNSMSRIERPVLYLQHKTCEWRFWHSPIGHHLFLCLKAMLKFLLCRCEQNLWQFKNCLAAQEQLWVSHFMFIFQGTLAPGVPLDIDWCSYIQLSSHTEHLPVSDHWLWVDFQKTYSSSGTDIWSPFV